MDTSGTHNDPVTPVGIDGIARLVHSEVMQQAARRSADREQRRRTLVLYRRHRFMRALALGLFGVAVVMAVLVVARTGHGATTPSTIAPVSIGTSAEAVRAALVPRTLTLTMAAAIPDVEIAINGIPHELGRPFPVLSVDLDGLFRARVRVTAPGYKTYYRSIYFAADVTHEVELSRR